MQLGVCYYPEQWPEAWWADDAKRMRAMGISHVRIAEFAWSLIEPEPNQFMWGWLDRAINTLHEAGLYVILCTPTATPPKWLIDANPDILAWDASDRPRRFGSRRHYCFSSTTYRQHSQRITAAISTRYGEHPAVVAWQTDNEYGCHDTVLSYSESARKAFRLWLGERYTNIEQLNAAWGCTFWSQCYRSFDEVDPPNCTVTEANPSHRLDWQRFASDEVVQFNREQVEILRKNSPNRPITHNFMGFFTGFDHHAVSADLDIASWDSYPLGFTQMFFLTPQEKTKWARQGHPDIPSFHHDLYRGMCLTRTNANNKKQGRWWVMEQQPGPVNWASWNPLPQNGMVRLWTWQAFAHGAEVVSYFRWRQAPFAQEQMHAGLQLPNRDDDQGALEATQVAQELATLRAQLPIDNMVVQAATALVFDYDALWMSQIQPQGADYNGLELCFRLYSTLRQLGLNVNIVSAITPLQDYKLIVLPAMLHINPTLLAALNASTAQLVLAPRTGSKTAQLHIPDNLAPGSLHDLTGITVKRVASQPPGIIDPIQWGNDKFTSTRWREEIELHSASAEASFVDGGAAICCHKNVRYVAAWLDTEGWLSVLTQAAVDAGIKTSLMPDGLRVSHIGEIAMAFNFSDDAIKWRPNTNANLLLGDERIAPYDMALWHLVAPSS